MSKYYLEQYVKNIKLKDGLTHEQFANKLEVCFSTLKQVELGNPSIPQKKFFTCISSISKLKS